MSKVSKCLLSLSGQEQLGMKCSKIIFEISTEMYLDKNKSYSFKCGNDNLKHL